MSRLNVLLEGTIPGSLNKERTALCPKFTRHDPTKTPGVIWLQTEIAIGCCLCRYRVVFSEADRRAGNGLLR